MRILICLGFLFTIFSISNQQLLAAPDLGVIKFYTLQSDAELSKLCKNQSDLYYESLISSKELWSKTMIDASSKIQPGLLSANWADLGAFDQCLGISNTENDINGKFCYTNIKIPIPKKHKEEYELDSFQPEILKAIQPFVAIRNKVDFRTIVLRWSICVPSGCTAADVSAHLNSYFKIGGSLPITLPKIAQVTENDCISLDSKLKLTAGSWTFIAILSIMAIIIIVSTTYDVWLYYVEQVPKYKILVAFSWYSNFKSLTSINKNSDQLLCLNGIRFLSILWIIHGHEFLSKAGAAMVNQKDIEHWMKWEPWTWFTFGSSVSVDTFFVLSGCLLMYGFLKSQAKKVPFSVPLFYIHRYIRLTPAYAAVIVFYVTLLQYMGSGPLWHDNISELVTNCEKYWWSGILYIQNYVDANNQCVGQTWYLSVDMQLFVFAPIILLSIKKWPKLVPYIFTSLMIIFTIIPMVIAWCYDLRDLQNGMNFQVYYAQTYARAGPWIFGLWLGYILYHKKSSPIRINKLLVTLIWILTIVAMIFIVFSNYKTLRPKHEQSKAYHAFFTGFHRNVWAFAIGWIIFACSHGYGGPVNWFLSLSMFQVFAKLTYSIYLLHMVIQTMRVGSSRTSIYFSNMNVLFSFFGTTCITIFVAFIWVLTFEYPFSVIDNILISAVSNLISRRPVKKEFK